jgi:hypothetical protein
MNEPDRKMVVDITDRIIERFDRLLAVLERIAEAIERGVDLEDEE